MRCSFIVLWIIVFITDVVGNCPTKYNVEVGDGRVIVTKEKNHQKCHQRYHTPSLTHIPWLKTPLPITQSASKCTQEIEHQIYQAIKCEDATLVKPMYGSYKYIIAKQESTLTFFNKEEFHPFINASIFHTALVKSSLLYEYREPKKNESLVLQLEATLVRVCHSTMKLGQPESATYMAQSINLMNLVPPKYLPQFLERIRNGQICPDNYKLQSFFLDSIAFSTNCGAILIMVDEIANGRVSGVRSMSYAFGFYNFQRPSICEIEALFPVFEVEDLDPTVTLAAATFTNTYCRHNPQCLEIHSVRIMMTSLNTRLQAQCSPLSEPEDQASGLVTLKALGNMGVMTQEVATTALRCVRTEGVDTVVRVAAAQAFRNVPCHQIGERWGGLLGVALDQTLNTEVRIAAYLAGLHCASEHGLHHFLDKLSYLKDTQVRNFILSHLSNLQQSDVPEKQDISYILSNITLPRDFEVDMRKYSGNVDVSYWAPSLGVGIDLDSNIIYAPGSFFPRSFDFNLSAALDGTTLNIGQLGARFQGLETIIAQVFGPDGYFKKTDFHQIIQDAAQLILHGHQQSGQGGWQEVSNSIISNLLNKIYASSRKVLRADLNFRYNGQDLSFLMLKGSLLNLLPANIRQELISYLHQFILSMTQTNLVSSHAAQVNLDYYFPTIQGIPLKLHLCTTLVASLFVETNFSSILSSRGYRHNLVNASISFSVESDGFIGFDSHMVKTGLKTKNTVYGTNGVVIKVTDMSSSEAQVEVLLPGKMEVSAKSETFLMRSRRGQPDTKITPPGMRDIRSPARSCFTSLESVLGLSLCYDINVPDIISSNDLPLVASPATARIYVQKFESSMKGYNIDAVFQNSRGRKTLSFETSTYGANRTLKGDFVIFFIREQEYDMLSGSLRGPQFSSNTEFSIYRKENEPGFDMFTYFQSEDFIVSRGMKVGFINTIRLGFQSQECVVYYGDNRNFPQESLVLQIKLSKQVLPRVDSLALLVKTRHILADYLDYNLEVEGGVMYFPSVNLLLPVMLHRLEFHANLSEWRAASSYRKSSQSAQKTEYAGSFNLTRSQQGFIIVKAGVEVQGQMGLNLIIKTEVRGQFGSSAYKSAIMTYGERMKKGIEVQVRQSSDDAVSTHMADLQLLYLQNGRDHVLVWQTDIPGKINQLNTALRVAPETQTNKVGFELVIKQSTRVVLHTHGTFGLDLRYTFSNLNVDIITAATSNTSGPYRFSGDLTLTWFMQRVSLNIMHRENPAFLLRLDTNYLPGNETTISTKVLLPGYFEFKSQVTADPLAAYVMFELLILPEFQKIKSATLIQLGEGYLGGQVEWEGWQLRGSDHGNASFVAHIIEVNKYPYDVGAL